MVNRKHLAHGSVLLGAVVACNFLNFLFNALLGRWLSLENFSLVTLVITFYYLASIFINSLGSTINFSVSRAIGKGHVSQVWGFFQKMIRKTLLIALIVSGVWVALTPFLMHFFHVSSAWPFISLVPIIIFGVYSYQVIGYFQGMLQFIFAALILVSEAIIKLIVGSVITLLGWGQLAYLSLPISLLGAAGIAVLCLSFFKKNEITKSGVTELTTFSFPKAFFMTTLVMAVGSTLFFSVDLILVRHFFSPEISGQYALLSLMGKMIYFFSTVLNIFTLPMVARAQSEKKLSQLFWLLMGGTVLLAIFSWLCLGLFGDVVAPLLFGSKVLAVVGLLPWYALAIGSYAVAAVITSYHIVRQQYVFSYCAIGAIFLFITLIFVRHSSLGEIVSNIAITCFLLLTSLIILHFLYDKRHPIDE